MRAPGFFSIFAALTLLVAAYPLPVLGHDSSITHDHSTKIVNCNWVSTIEVKTYDSGDEQKWIPRERKFLSPGEQETFSCGNWNCQMEIKVIVKKFEPERAQASKENILIFYTLGGKSDYTTKSTQDPGDYSYCGWHFRNERPLYDYPSAGQKTFSQVCLRDSDGAIVSGAWGPNKDDPFVAKRRGSSCNADEELEIIDLNGGALKWGDEIEVRGGVASLKDGVLTPAPYWVALPGRAGDLSQSKSDAERGKDHRFTIRSKNPKNGNVISEGDKVHFVTSADNVVIAKGSTKGIRHYSPYDYQRGKPESYEYEILSFPAQPTLTTIGGADTHGEWGTWGLPALCPRGESVKGYQMKSERRQGDNDDTALNDVRLFCSSGSSIQSLGANYGDWLNRADCSGAVVGFDIRIEPGQGNSDDTGANSVRLDCHAGNSIAANSHTGWGNWSAKHRCPAGQVVVGFRTRVEPYQGSGDDTSMNGMEMFCARPGIEAGDRLGSDFHWFMQAAADPLVCQTACSKNANCVAWTYLKPSHQGPKCHLKNAVPTLDPTNDCCLSGLAAR